MAQNPNELISPESEAWSAPISEEWNRIYSRFLEDVRLMIQRGGGRDKVNVDSYGDGYFDQLSLHLSYQGGLLRGERDQEAVPAALPAK